MIFLIFESATITMSDKNLTHIVMYQRIEGRKHISISPFTITLIVTTYNIIVNKILQTYDGSPQYPWFNHGTSPL